MVDSNKTVIYSLTANEELAKEIADTLNLPLKKAIVNHFADGEIICEIGESVREKDVYVIQSTCPPVTTNLFEILVFVHALKRASAGKITVIIPYFGYARQDRKSRPRQPITSKLVADMLTAAGVDRVIVVELHTAQIQGFFSCLIDEINTSPMFANYFKDKVNDNTVFVEIELPDQKPTNGG
jgi:ribose-phosphate pyrophosphokinase